MTPFFVGWMGLPRGLVGFIATAGLAIAGVGTVFAALFVAALPPRQSGQWGDGEVGFDGLLVTKPYPVVRVAASENRPAQAVLLVDEWKFGLTLGRDFADGQSVHVQGYAVRRGSVTVLQVDARPQHIAASGSAPPELRDAGTHALTGEIVDSKCWTGAMNPGDGKAHKGCGSLCLLGGIPALFITSAPDEGLRWYLLADADGNALGEEIRARVGERLTLKGRVLEAADLPEFRIDPDSAAMLLTQAAEPR